MNLLTTEHLPKQITNHTSRRSLSPLRYPGGKSRAINQVRRLIPSNITEILSPFFGGGNVELSCAADGIRVYGYDAFQPLVNFWQQTIRDPAAVARLANKHYPLSREAFYDLQRQYSDLSGCTEQAAAFFTLNRASYSGTTLSGGMSPGHPRFNESAIRRLEYFSTRSLTVDFSDFAESIGKHPDMFIYLDPPYANGEKLYGNRGDMHEGFNHEKLAGLLRSRPCWVLSYNDCQQVRNLYSGHQFVDAEWTYGMNNTKNSNEVLILSRDFQ